MDNDSVVGYIILALKKLGYKEKEIEKVTDELSYQFDTITENEAKQYYCSGKWRD